MIGCPRRTSNQCCRSFREDREVGEEAEAPPLVTAAPRGSLCRPEGKRPPLSAQNPASTTAACGARRAKGTEEECEEEEPPRDVRTAFTNVSPSGPDRYTVRILCERRTDTALSATSLCSRQPDSFVLTLSFLCVSTAPMLYVRCKDPIQSETRHDAWCTAAAAVPEVSTPPRPSRRTRRASCCGAGTASRLKRKKFTSLKRKKLAMPK